MSWVTVDHNRDARICLYSYMRRISDMFQRGPEKIEARGIFDDRLWKLIRMAMARLG